MKVVLFFLLFPLFLEKGFSMASASHYDVGNKAYYFSKLDKPLNPNDDLDEIHKGVNFILFMGIASLLIPILMYVSIYVGILLWLLFAITSIFVLLQTFSTLSRISKYEKLKNVTLSEEAIKIAIGWLLYSIGLLGLFGLLFV